MIVQTNEIKESLLEELRTRAQVKKRVCFVQFGHDAASTTFVRIKSRMAQQLGIETVQVQHDVATTDEALRVVADIIEQQYDGMVIQLPLPTGLDTELIIDSVPTALDIDMLSEDAKEQYRMATTERTAPVAAAVQEILWHHKIMLPGKKIVVVGKGRLVGEPVAMLLDRQELPYAWIDIETPEDKKRAALAEADVIISGAGAAHSITPDMVKEGVVLIDAGTSEHPSSSSGQGPARLVGDIDPACADKALLYTPVPGGVGPLTVVCLLRNLFVQ